jgi:hypothetical protein
MEDISDLIATANLENATVTCSALKRSTGTFVDTTINVVERWGCVQVGST